MAIHTLDPDAGGEALRKPAHAREGPRTWTTAAPSREGRPGTGHRPDPLGATAVVVHDAVEVGLFITAQDLVDREPSPATLGTVVAALVQQVGQQARREGADEELVAALTDTVGNAAEGRANRAAVTPAVTNRGAATVTTIKVSYAPEHEVYAHQVTADTAVLQHLHDPLHGWGWTLFFRAPGGHRVGDYFIPGDLTDVDDAVAAAKRRLDVQHADH